jgi:hypothetical protein
MGCFRRRRWGNYSDKPLSPALRAGDKVPFFTRAHVEFVGYGLQKFVSS